MIEEVPINSGEVAEPEVAPEVVSDVVTPAPKKRGRPAGSKGKPKPPKPPVEVEEEEEAPEEVAPKPKKKAAPKKKAVEAVRKKAAKKKPVVQSSDSEEEPRERRAGTDTRAVAMEVMQLLSNQHAGRVAARRQKYAGWFAN